MQNESAVLWETFTTPGGIDYEVGAAILSGHRIRRRQVASAGPPFAIAVDWPLAKDYLWIDTTTQVKKVSRIGKYCLYASNCADSKYVLWFNTEEVYNYHFLDASGNEYTYSPTNPGDCVIRFNSNNPNIVTTLTSHQSLFPSLIIMLTLSVCGSS